MAHTPFLGPAYSARSPDLSNQRAWNIFAEIVEAPKGQGSEIGGFYSRPGEDLVVTVGTGPVRGMMRTDFGLFVVSGGSAYQLSQSFSATRLGSLTTTTGPVSIVANTNQVAFFDGVAGYSWSTSSGYHQIALPFNNPGKAVYQDGFVVVNQQGTIFLWQSNLNDLTTWEPLNFSSEDGQPDNIVALAEFHRQVVVFKELHIAFWVNAGLNGFVFQRLDGVYVERGCVAPASVVNIDENLIWLGQGEEGQGVVYLAKGYAAERISTYAIEFQIASYATMSDAIAFSYLQEGHMFYVLTFPTGNATWVFDLTASKKFGSPMWFQWGGFSNGVLNRWNANCQASFAGKVLVGDYQNGNIYALDMNALTDNGAVKKCLRSWRHTPDNPLQTVKCNYIDVGCDTGLQVAPGANPQLVLRQSFDAGGSWSAEMYRPAGVTGATTQNIRFTRLGATKRGLNSDRIFELSTTDQWRIGWLAVDYG